jgi:hypothetical protein
MIGITKIRKPSPVFIYVQSAISIDDFGIRVGLVNFINAIQSYLHGKLSPKDVTIALIVRYFSCKNINANDDLIFLYSLPQSFQYVLSPNHRLREVLV